MPRVPDLLLRFAMRSDWQSGQRQESLSLVARDWQWEKTGHLNRGYVRPQSSVELKL
jgi:hypothetical protein